MCYQIKFHWFEDLCLEKIKYMFISKGSEEAGVVEQLKSQICDNIALYAQKYDEEFQQFLPQFVTDIWGLLVNTSLEPKYDLVTILYIRNYHNYYV